MKWKSLCKFKSCQTLNSNKVIICFDHNIADVNIGHVNIANFNKPQTHLKSYILTILKSYRPKLVHKKVQK